MSDKINEILRELQSLSIPSTFGNVRALNAAMTALALLNDDVVAIEKELAELKGEKAE